MSQEMNDRDLDCFDYSQLPPDVAEKLKAAAVRIRKLMAEIPPSVHAIFGREYPSVEDLWADVMAECSRLESLKN